MNVLQRISSIFAELEVEYGESEFLSWHRLYWEDLLANNPDELLENIPFNFDSYKWQLELKLRRDGPKVPYEKWYH